MRLNFRLLCFATISMDNGQWLYYSFAAGNCHRNELCSRLYSIEIKFYSKKNKKSLLSHPLGDLEVTSALHR